MSKKGGMTIIKNENNEMIFTRTVMDRHMYIDYRKLNKATHKDHSSLPFINQILERLAKNSYFCYLDGYLGFFFFKSLFHSNNQEKTKFTCPYGYFL